MGFKESNPLYSIIHRISKKAYIQCDHIAVSSKPFFEYLQRVNQIPRTKMSYLPQYASEDMLAMDFEKEPNGHFDFLYIGNIGMAQDMSCRVERQERCYVSHHW